MKKMKKNKEVYVQVNSKTKILLQPKKGESEEQFTERMKKKYANNLTLEGTTHSNQIKNGYRNKQFKDQ